MKNINTLAKELDFKTPFEYYEYCIDSYINGNFSQCEKLFKAMKQENRKYLLTYIKNEYPDNTEWFDYYFNLL